MSGDPANLFANASFEKGQDLPDGCATHAPWGGIAPAFTWDAAVARKVKRSLKMEDPGKPGRQYVLFLPEGGAIDLDLRAQSGRFTLRWIDVSSGEWAGEGKLAGGRIATVRAPGEGPWVAAITNSESRL